MSLEAQQGSIVRWPKIAETIQDLKSKNAVGIVEHRKSDGRKISSSIGRAAVLCGD